VDFPQPIANDISENPIVSIVVPTYIKTQKNVDDIKNLLLSISTQTVKPDSIIIIDDCSPISYSFSEHIQVYRQVKNSGPAKARNLGKKLLLKMNLTLSPLLMPIAYSQKLGLKILSRRFNVQKNFKYYQAIPFLMTEIGLERITISTEH
jgi:glycosyltransferase involved in cell wall biosynthesis